MAGGLGGKQVGSISIQVLPDTTRFREDLRRQLQVIEDSLKATIQADVELDTLKARGDMAVLMGKLKAQAAGGVTINAKVDQDVLGKALSGIGGGGGGGGGSWLLNPGIIAAGLGAVVALAAPLLGLITTALLALPGLLSLVLAPIAAITLGLDGFKKAAEAIKPQFDHLKQVMSDVAQTAFTPVLQNLADTVFPALERALPSVTQGLANLAQGAVNAFNQPGNMDKFESSISRIGAALSNMSPGFQGITSGIIGLIDQFSLKLPAITEWFNKAGTDFDAWVQKISADGSLSTAFDGLGKTLKTILDTLGELALAGMKWISKPANMDDFISGLKSIAESLKSIADLSANLKDVFANMLPSFNWEGIKKDLTAPFTSENAPWRDLQVPKNLDIYDPSAAARWRGAVDEVKTSAEDAGVAAEATKQKLLDMLQGGGPAAAGGSLTALQDSLTAAPTALAPVIPPPDTAPAEAKIAEYQSFVDTISAQVRGSLQQATSGESLPAPNFEAFKAAWTGMSTFVTEQVGILKTATSTLGADISTGFQQVSVGLSTAWSGLPAIAAQSFQPIAAAVNTALGQVVVTVVNKGAEVVAELTTWPAKFTAAVGDLSGALVSAGGNLVQGLINGIQARQGEAVAAASTMAGAVAVAARGALGIKSPSTVFHEIGMNTAQGLQDGIEGGFQGVIQRATELTKQLADAVNNGMTGLDAEGFQQSLKKQIAEIGVQSDDLKVQLNGTTDKGQKDGIRGQRQQLQDLRDQLNLQQDQLGFSEKYGQSLDKNKDTTGDTLNKMIDAGKSFADANVKQFLGDIGISGGGALTTLADTGIGFLTQSLSKLVSGGAGGTNIHVNSIDEGLAARQNIVNKQALQYRQR